MVDNAQRGIEDCKEMIQAARGTGNIIFDEIDACKAAARRSLAELNGLTHEATK